MHVGRKRTTEGEKSMHVGRKRARGTEGVNLIRTTWCTGKFNRGERAFVKPHGTRGGVCVCVGGGGN
jgi:hypothetical protein